MSKKPRSTLREYVEAALWALVLTLFLRAFVIQAFRIPSESMTLLAVASGAEVRPMLEEVGDVSVENAESG